jgi:hypothetical protein
MKTKTITTTLVMMVLISTFIIALPVAITIASDSPTIEKSVSWFVAFLGDTRTITLDVLVPTGFTMTVEDQLPNGLNYVPGSFEVNGVSITPMVLDGTVSTTLGAGSYTIEFDVIVTQTGASLVIVENWAYLKDNGATVAQASVDIWIHPYRGFTKHADLISTGDGDLVIEVGEDVVWLMVIEVENTLAWTMEDVVVTDRFGAEIEIDNFAPGDTIPATRGSASYFTKGKSDKIFLTWEVGDLAPGETAVLAFEVSTDTNPGKGKGEPLQEYTSPGHYELNSGAVLKFIGEHDYLYSDHTASIEVDVTS